MAVPEFAKMTNELREQAGIPSNHQLARRMDIDPSHLTRAMNFERKHFSPEIAERYYRALDNPNKTLSASSRLRATLLGMGASDDFINESIEAIQDEAVLMYLEAGQLPLAVQAQPSEELSVHHSSLKYLPDGGLQIGDAIFAPDSLGVRSNMHWLQTHVNILPLDKLLLDLNPDFQR